MLGLRLKAPVYNVSDFADYFYRQEKIRDMLESVSQEALSERSFALVFGSNMVEVNFLRLVSPSVKLAKVSICFSFRKGTTGDFQKNNFRDFKSNTDWEWSLLIESIFIPKNSKT